MSSTSETIGRKVFIWDKGAYGAGVYRIGKRTVTAQEWEAERAIALALAAGYYVRQGSYQGTTDDRLGRWYVGKDGEAFRPYGAGYATKREALAALVGGEGVA